MIWGVVYRHFFQGEDSKFSNYKEILPSIGYSGNYPYFLRLSVNHGSGAKMELKKVLEKNKSVILKKWFDVVINTYPLDTAQFLKSQNDRFSNPVGITVSEGLNSLFNELITEPDANRLRVYLDPIIRIRAIQDFTPSHATSFILSLKSIIREILKKQLEKDTIPKELQQIEAKIDSLLLLAFDIYMECREKIYTLKANDEKNKVFKAFKRAGLIYEVPDENPGINESNV
jgi:hypothetical protein